MVSRGQACIVTPMTASAATNAAAASDPSNYKSHPQGYCCVDCNGAARIGVAVLHSARCDIAPKSFVLPADQTPADDADLVPSQRKANADHFAAVRKAARANPPKQRRGSVDEDVAAFEAEARAGVESSRFG